MLYFFIKKRVQERKMIKKYRRSLSDAEAKVLTELSYSGQRIFAAKDALATASNAKSMLDGLTRKGWIIRLRNGIYMVVPLEAGYGGAGNWTLHGFALASAVAEDYYISYISALNYWGMTDRVPEEVLVATAKPQRSRKVIDATIRFVSIGRRKMFGFGTEVVDGLGVNVASREKAIVDCIERPKYCGGIDEVVKALRFSKDALDLEKVFEYAVRMGNSAVLKRLGYIAERGGLGELANKVANAKLGEGYAYLDPSGPKSGKIRERWRIIENARIGS